MAERWEFSTVTYSHREGIVRTLGYLNDFGARRWRVCAVVDGWASTTFYLMRRIEATKGPGQ